MDSKSGLFVLVTVKHCYAIRLCHTNLFRIKRFFGFATFIESPYSVKMLYQTILPSEVAERLKNGEEINLIDVREPMEHEIASVEGAKLLPLSQFNEWIETLNPSEEIIVMCHHGIRSANLCIFLVRNDFEKVFNLEGGIDLWSKEVDANIPKY